MWAAVLLAAVGADTPPFRNLSGTVPLPTPQHMAYHHAELGVLISSGMGASMGVESSPCVDHKPYPLAPDPPPATRYDGAPDPEQWVLAAKALGARYATLVASEMFGFSLWPSVHSNYTVAQSACKLAPPCDVLGAFVEACKKHGLRPGVFYSVHFNDHMSMCGFHVAPPALCKPDPPAKLCPSQAEYDAYALAQLKELATAHGEVMTELWFDGGISASIMPALRAELPQLFPQAVCHSCVPGETDTPRPGDALFRGVRWAAPSEAAHVPYPQWAGSLGCSQETADMGGSPTAPDYCPASGDTVLRQHCWYGSQPSCPESTIKPTAQSLQEYVDSVGVGANMIIAVAPNSSGLVPAADMAAYTALGAAIASLNASLLTIAPAAALASPCGAEGCVVQWRSRFGVAFALTKGTVELREGIEGGQRIADYSVDVRTTGGWRTVVSGVTVGHRRLQPFSLDAALHVSAVRVVIKASYGTPTLLYAAIHAAGAWHDALRSESERKLEE